MKKTHLFVLLLLTPVRENSHLPPAHQTSSQEGLGGGPEEKGQEGVREGGETPILPQHRASDFALL